MKHKHHNKTDIQGKIFSYTNMKKNKKKSAEWKQQQNLCIPRLLMAIKTSIKTSLIIIIINYYYQH